MYKKVFVLERRYYSSEVVENLTEKDLEEWVAEEDYDNNYTIIKIDANNYSTPQEAIENECCSCMESVEDVYHVVSFGFDECNGEKKQEQIKDAMIIIAADLYRKIYKKMQSWVGTNNHIKMLA